MGGISSKEDGGRSRSTSPDTNDKVASSSQLESVAEAVHNGPIHSLCPIVKEDCIVSGGGGDKNVIVYCYTRKCNKEVFQGPTKDITKICYNNKSTFVYASSRDRSLYAWKWPQLEQESNSSSSYSGFSQPDSVLQGHTLGVTALDTSDDYPQLLCSGSRDNSVCLWDVDVGKPVSSMYAPRNLVTDLKWISGEKAVVQSSEDKTLRVWDLNTCSTVQQFRARNYLQTCCDVSHDQKQFVAGSSGSGNVGEGVTLWDRRNERKPLKEFKGHTETVESCRFISHQNTNLMCSVCRGSTIRLWDLDTGLQIYYEHLPGTGPLTDIATLKEENIACSSFSGGISLWTLEQTEDKHLTLALKSNYMIERATV